MMIICENTGKVTVEGKFPYTIGRKNVDSGSIFYQFCRCWVHKRFSGISGKLIKDSKDECQLCVYQQLDIVEDFPYMEKLQG